MTNTLNERFSSEKTRKHLILSVTRIIESQVSQKQGLRFWPLKTGLSMLKGLRPGALEALVAQLLDEFIDVFEPFFIDGQPTAALLNGHEKTKIAQDLIEIGDKRAGRAKNKAILKLYKQVRSIALEEVQLAIPEVVEALAHEATHPNF